MTNLSVVIPVMNQHPMFRAVLNQLVKVTGADTEIVIIDNGSTVPFGGAVNPSFVSPYGHVVKVVRNPKSVGVYPTFEQGMLYASGDIVAFFHSDLIVWEKDWDRRLLDQFDSNPNLGLVGFIGSNEIDSCGGRGSGTTSQFMGYTLESPEGKWSSSPASAHGHTNRYYTRAAVVDGCAMVIRRSAWSEVGVKINFPPHHFYDRLISCQMIEKGFHVGVLGIACDHISGQTVNQELSYDTMAREWCEANGLGMEGHNWDSTVYLEAERRFLREYRNEKHLIPIRF